MTRILLITTLLILTSLSVYAQRPDFSERQERMQAHKIAFITDELDLTAAEAEKFWPIYNAYQAEEKAIKENLRKQLQSTAGMSDDEALALLSQQLDNEEEKVALQRRYVQELKMVIPGKKILKLFNAERNFVRRVLREYRNRRQE